MSAFRRELTVTSGTSRLGTRLICVGLCSVADTPKQLRHQAEHCRHLADSQNDERTRLILKSMASEFDQQALDAEDDAAHASDDYKPAT